MKQLSLHLCQILNGYEVCVFDEDNEMIDFEISNDCFKTLFEALRYVDDISNSSDYSIVNIVYELPTDISMSLDSITSKEDIYFAYN